MSEPIAPGFSARLRRLPGQLVLALINATAILVIAAAILALVAISRIDHLAGRVAETMTDAVLAKAGGLPKDALADLPGSGRSCSGSATPCASASSARTPPCRRKRRNCGKRSPRCGPASTGWRARDRR